MKILLVSLTLSMMSCATMFGDNDATVRVSSQPHGAEVFLNGTKVGRTPELIVVENKLIQNVVKLKLPGHESESIQVRRSFQAVSLFNLWNPLFWGIDILTGNVMRVATKSIATSLTPKTPELTSDAKEI